MQQLAKSIWQKVAAATTVSPSAFVHRSITISIMALIGAKLQAGESNTTDELIPDICVLSQEILGGTPNNPTWELSVAAKMLVFWWVMARTNSPTARSRASYRP
jgi:hypothetical protein